MKSINTIILVLFSACIISCSNNTDQSNQTNMLFQDTHSYAIPKESRIDHLIWKANVDFGKEIIYATATFNITSSGEAEKIMLDTKDLIIKKVTDEQGSELNFQVGEARQFIGSPLVINIDPAMTQISIEYETSMKAEALQWLQPSQTADKREPFLFTQSQAILARSWIPIQDSPGIRFTYEAEVTVPSNLLALMSAENPVEKNGTGTYKFKMNQKIPAYLMALAVGDIEFAAIGSRTGVYAEPSVIEKASYEFAEMEEMLIAAEKLYGQYQWDRYDLIVLPPSFPFGGMENPRLTFATPTILAGDRSLTSLVAHELAHSWSGNLVTNATWDDFWLNEGFTVYFEQRIMEALYGRDYSEMLAALSLKDLENEVDEMIKGGKKEDTHLKLDLKGRNPDDGMNTIAYDKGYNFLRTLEETAGREIFDDFLKKYFSTNAFSVMTTESFIEYMNQHLIEKNELDITASMYESWIYGPGLPEDRPKPVSNKFEIVEEAVQKWMGQEDKNEIVSNYGAENWSSHEWLHFVRNLPTELTIVKMKSLDDAFEFTKSGNSEILSAWLKLVIRNQYEDGYSKLEEFLINTGRRKFLMPLYTEMARTEKGIAYAREIYQKARPNYHYVSSSSIDALLEPK